MLTATEAALLGLLRKGPMSGYDLRKDVERSVGYFWAPAKTQIYATLPRLVEAGRDAAKGRAERAAGQDDLRAHGHGPKRSPSGSRKRRSTPDRAGT